MSSSDKPALRVDWCTHEAARYAVEHWHYSRRMPMPPLVKVGAWEGGKYVGCVLFARGANMNIGAPYGLTTTEVAELVRVALTKHEHEVSRVVALAVRFLRKQSTGLRLLVSYADPAEGHHGGIYQAMGWTYDGTSAEAVQFFHEGKWKHQREVTAVSFASTGQPGSGKVKNCRDLPQRRMPGKHRYLLALDDDMKRRILPLSKPYPKRAETSSPDGAPGGEGGATPTSALHDKL